MKTEVNDEYPEVLAACKGARVTYSAFAGLGEGVSGYLWSVVGDVSHNASGNHVTVDWGMGDWGIVTASVVTTDGDTCTWAVRVKLIDIPTAAAVTIPAYTVTPTGTKVIRVCKGADIQFLDRSEAAGGDIAGCLWQSNVYPSAATENYTLENVTVAGKVTHRVYNNCGCYDEEAFEIEIMDGWAAELTITVKPNLEIEGWDRICVTNACSLQTVPAVGAAWTAYDLGSNNAVAATATGATFTHTFGHAGRYLVTASHAAYCGPASFVLTVRDVPSAPTAADLDTANSHTACPGLGIALSGTPSDPDYTLVREPVCTTASPQLYSGDSVTIGYQAEVCDVRVYNYDRRLQCQSANAYVHTVAPLTPAPLNIPQNVTVCPGSLIVWGQNEVPDQSADGMLYEWTLEPTKQYCASVQGSHLTPGITLLVNNLNSLPATFYIKLTRTFCGGATVDTIIHITVTDSSSSALTIAGPDTVCLGEVASFAGGGGNATTYLWTAEGSQQNASASFSHAFSHNGLQTVTLSAMPGYTCCTNPDYRATTVKQVVVNPRPLTRANYNNGSGIISLVPALDPNDYIFAWTLFPGNQSLPPQFLGNNPSVVFVTDGDYTCTITDRATGCTLTVSTWASEMTFHCGDLTLTLSDFNYCQHIQRVTSPQYGSNVSWSVSGGGYEIETSSTQGQIADITVHDIGVYTVNASTMSLFNPCIEGKKHFIVDFLPELELVPACDRIIIRNKSRYAPPVKIVFLKVTNDCNSNVDPISFPVSQQTDMVYIPSSIPTGSCTYTFTLSGYGVDYNIASCEIGSATIGVPPLTVGSNPVSIALQNPYNPLQTCDNTPVELTASLNYTTAQAESYLWNFGDGSSYTNSVNHVFHTFASGTSRNVNVSIIDNHGCIRTSLIPLTVTSSFNDLQDGLLSYPLEPKCPFVGTTYLSFSPNNPNNHYTWSTPIVNDPPPHPTHHSGSYSVLVVNDNFCHKEASLFVKFKNAPTARILADNLNCCVGDRLMFNGDVGPSSDNMDYLWTIVGPNGYYQTATTPTVSFPAPQTGSYAVTLTVTDHISQCSATSHETVTVNVQPPAPTMAFSGSPCIADAPVGIAATGFSGEMHWSNGATSATTNYNYPGPVRAYYFDPSIGCPSAVAELHIDEQPDFDALLTGCYEKCKYSMPNELPVYGFPNQALAWIWNLNFSSIATGNGNYAFTPLMLPLQGFGKYQLEVNNGAGLCSETSPLLNIRQVEACTCDSIDIQIVARDQVSDCPLIFKIIVKVCNISSTEIFCFQDLNVLPGQESVFHLMSHDFAGATLMPGQCSTFTVQVEVLSLQPAVARFRLNSTCESCFRDFVVGLTPKVNCSRSMYGFDLHLDAQLSNPAVAYFNFSAMLPSSSFTLLDFWSEPPMVVDCLVTSTGVQGLGMFDVATLTQLASNGESICFHALVCDNRELCELTYCFDARILYAELVAMGILRNREANGGNEKAVPQETSRLDTPTLVPNPSGRST